MRIWRNNVLKALSTWLATMKHPLSLCPHVFVFGGRSYNHLSTTNWWSKYHTEPISLAGFDFQTQKSETWCQEGLASVSSYVKYASWIRKCMRLLTFQRFDNSCSYETDEYVYILQGSIPIYRSKQLQTLWGKHIAYQYIITKAVAR